MAAIVGALPETTIQAPPLPLEVTPPADGDVKVAFGRTAPLSVALNGRAVVLSPSHVGLIAVPELLSGAPAPPPPGPSAAPAAGQAARLAEIFERSLVLAAGAPSHAPVAVVMSRATFAALLEKAWAAFDPRVTVDSHLRVPIDEAQLDLVPGHASCGNPCGDVAKCGSIGSCKIVDCSTVIEYGLCRAFCPVPWFCNKICDPITRRICNESPDQNCISRIESCAGDIAKCAGAWTSGLQLHCEAALNAIKLTGFRGLAKVSGDVGVEVRGHAKGGALSVAPTLDSVSLDVSGSATASLAANVAVRFVDFGHFLLCPNGTLKGAFELSSTPATKVTAVVEWHGDESGLVGKLTFADISIPVATAEPPIVTLVKSNPALLTCQAGQTVAGLSILAVPNLTRDLLAGGVRKALGEKNGAIAGAVIDGKYTYVGAPKPLEVRIPPKTVDLAGEAVTIAPRLTQAGVVVAVERRAPIAAATAR